MTTYNFDDTTIPFDFYSTDPPVFRITVQEEGNRTGFVARALFRGSHKVPHLDAIQCWADTEGEALASLLEELRNRYTTPTEFFQAELCETVPDPRAGLRRCIFQAWLGGRWGDPEPGYFHLVYADSDGDAMSVVERENGELVPACGHVRFTDWEADNE